MDFGSIGSSKFLNYITDKLTGYAYFLSSLKLVFGKTLFQVKYLSTAVSVYTPDIADLRFTGLEIGKVYKLTGQIRMFADDTGGHYAKVRIYHDEVQIGGSHLQYPINSAGTLIATFGVNTVPFVATATSIRVQYEENGSCSIGGNNTADETWLALEELPNHEITSKF